MEPILTNLDNGVSIYEASEEHLAEMAACHIAAFPGEFLSELGDGFLKAFYRYYMNAQGGICLVALDDETVQIVGLVAGGDPGIKSRFMRANIPLFLGTIVCKAVTNSYVRKRLGEHVGDLARKILRKLHLMRASEEYPPPPEDSAGTWSNLLSVCSHPEARGRGLGRMLMESFRTVSAMRGYKTMRLSVHNDNDAAIAIYEKCGWQPILTIPSGTYFKRSVQED